MKIVKFIILIVPIIALLIITISGCTGTKQNEKESGTENTFDMSDNSYEKENTTVFAFDISDYSWELENCREQINIGPVTTKNVAIDKAKQLWKEKFGNIYEINDLPIVVAYDEKNECWRVNGTLQDDGVDGAVPCALITKDGDVLAMWIG